MSQLSDHWYVRFPDGRVLHAASTAIVRQQLNAGRIPPSSSVRRSADEEWTALEWTREFADLASRPLRREHRAAREAPNDRVDLGAEQRQAAEQPPSGGLSARLDRSRLPAIGVRAMVHELLAALDGTLVRKKLAAAALAGLLAGLVLAWAQVIPALPVETAAPWAPWIRWVVAGALLLVIVTAAAALLTRLTYLELSRMRPARWREGAAGLTGTTVRIAAAQLLTAGVAVGVIVFLRLMPGILLGQAGAAGEAIAAGAAAFGMIVEVVLWPIIGFSLLLPPILVVEDCSVPQALVHWQRLLRADPGRVFLYEALALGLGLAATLLLALPWLALFTYQPEARIAAAVVFTRSVLAGLAAAPLLAYLMVANVFIYINLRYESGPARR
jgi:hypothetical protein